MKIAVACDKGIVAAHFGHCESFKVYDTKNKQISQEIDTPNPGHKPGYLPNFLHELGVNVIISGGMGSGAVEIFNEKNIEVIIGAKGEAKKAVIAFLNNELKTTGSVCHEHE